jgi:hypothetical protein
MEQDATLVTQTVAAVRGATSLDEAVDLLVKHLQPRFELWAVGFCSQVSGSTAITVLASWSPVDTLFDAGAEISADVSQIVQLTLGTLWKGQAATFTVGSDNDSLVDYLLREQGVASLLLLPIHRDDRILLMLGLGSGAADVFLHAEAGFFTMLSVGISESVLRLATTANGFES